MWDVLVSGAINWDTTLFTSEFPRPGGEMVVSRVTRVPGGKGGNVAVASARILGRDRVAIFGAVGNDEIGNEHLRIFKSYGIDTSNLQLLSGSESGQAYILVNGEGENLILTHFGANARVRFLAGTGRRLARYLRQARVLVVRDPPLDVAKRLLDMSSKYSHLRIWDPGIRALRRAKIHQGILRRVDYLVANEIEVEWLSGSSDQKRAAKKLSRVNPDLKIIATLGSEGCMMMRNRKAYRLPAFNLIRFGLKVVNTVGCGDAFVGVFSAAKAEGLSDEEALRWANLAGSFKATRRETRGSPTRRQLEYYLRRLAA